MSLGKLTVKNAFGINTKIKNPLCLSDDHQLAYICGHQAVVMNTETKDQSFISGISQPVPSLGISAIAASIPKRTIAIAEILEPTAIVTLYDSQNLRKRKVLQNSDLGSKEIRCLAFSSDGRFCLTQGAGPEWNLILWNIEKTVKIIGTVKISMSDDNPVNQVSFCPWDNNVILAIGKGIVRLFRIVEGQIRPVSINVRRDQANFISHSWLWDEKLVLGTEGGEILLIENLEFRAVVHPTPNDASELLPILSISPTSKGFVVGSTEGELWMFSAEDIKEQYKKEDKFTIAGGEGGVVGIVTTVDDSLICALDTQQIYHFTISNSNNAKDGGGGFDHVLTSFHAPNMIGDAAITGVDVALWRQIVVTCGKDHTVRVWNIPERKIDISKKFAEEPLALSVHPSGLYVVVAFADKIRLASILLDDIFVTKEFTVRSCNEIRFSRGGNYIAAVNGANVHVFNTYSGAMVSTLRGHTAKVRAISWMNMDTKLMTVGQEGTVYYWDAFTGARSPDSFLGVIPITAGVAFGDGSRAFTVSNERVLKDIPMAKPLDAQQPGQEVAPRTAKDMQLERHISCMAVDDASKLLFMGTGESELPGGVISIMTTPALSSGYDVMPLHNSPVTAICVSKDGSQLFTGDANGCLCVCDVEGANHGQPKLREGLISYDFVDEILVRKTDLDGRKTRINALIVKVEELTLDNEHQLRLKELEHKDKIREISQRFAAQLSAETENYDNLLQDKQVMEHDYRLQLDHIGEKHDRELSSVEARYKSKLAGEAARHKQLSAEIEEAHKKWNAENKMLVESHQTYLQKLSEEFEEKLNEEHVNQKKLQAEKSAFQAELEKKRQAIELDADQEIDEMKTRFEARLKLEEETSIGLMADHAVMKKNLQMLTKDADHHREEIRRLKDKEIRLIETIKSLEKDIQSHKKEIREREETITDKEKRIFDLKKKNQELEKFRFVLDYKIKELKLQIAPRENEIAIMKRQIEDMDLELEQYHKSNLALNLMIGELKLKLEGLRKELLSQSTRVDLNLKLLERFMKDLQDTWSVHEDEDALKAKVINLFRLYVQEDVSMFGSAHGGAGGADTDAQQKQYNRDREQMERNLDTLRRSLHTDAVMRKRDLGKMMRENVILTKQMNELRKDYKTLLIQKKAVDEALKAGPRGNIAEYMDILGIARAAGAAAAAPAISKSRQSPRSAALRTLSAGPASGMRGGRNNINDAWRELQMQEENIGRLEVQLNALCNSLEMDVGLMSHEVDQEVVRREIQGNKISV